MTIALESLIKQASIELGSDACRAGNHRWESEGGRGCPHDLTDNCGQAVYRCTTCGTYDYGEKGGPGDSDCQSQCQHRSAREVSIMAARRDPFDLMFSSVNGNARIYHRVLLRALRRQPAPSLP